MRWRAAGGMREALIVIACAAATAVPGRRRRRAGPRRHGRLTPPRPGPDSPPAGRSLFDYAVTREADGKPRPRRAVPVRAPGEAPRGARRLQAAVREAGAHPARPLAPAHGRVAGLLRVPARRRRDRRRARRARRAAPQGPDLPRLPGEERPGRGDQLQRGGRPVRVPDRARLPRGRRARGRVRAPRDVRRLPPEPRAALLAPGVGGDEREPARRRAPVSRPRRRGGERGERGDYHGVPIHRGVDVPNAIDAATDRANLLGVWQLLWRVGCGDGAAGARCRGAALVAALQYRLERRARVRRALAGVARRVPAGVRPHLERRAGRPGSPSRTRTFRTATRCRPRARAAPQGSRPRTSRPAFEPLAPRAPLEVWATPGRRPRAASWPASPGSSPTAESRALDRQLAARAGREPAVERRREAPCEIAWTRVERAVQVRRRDGCAAPRGGAPRPSRRARRGRRDRRARGRTARRRSSISRWRPARSTPARAARRSRSAAGARTRGSPTVPRSPASRSPGSRPRRAPGAASARCPRARPSPSSTTSRRCGAPSPRSPPSRATKHRSPLAPFSRARVLAPLFAQLGIPAREWCCEDASRLPPAVVEAPERPMPVDGAATPFAAFYPLCASCHATAERSPPNFLAGPPERVAASVKHCAPRIYARLALWRAAPAARDKTPMPPAVPSARGEAVRAGARDRRARAHRVRARARGERRGAAARPAPRGRLRAAAAVPAG